MLIESSEVPRERPPLDYDWRITSPKTKLLSV